MRCKNFLKTLADILCYPIGVLILLWFLPSIIRDLHEEERSLRKYYR